ncbi:MAG: biotin/lipoyl-binding protein [Myxococcales bacterium]|nr:biotin/lipoyl-binding protein [Myxococcales bacterium]
MRPAAGTGAPGLIPSAAVGRAQRFEVTVEGHTHQVSVELDDAGRPTRVLVDDRPCTVSLGADESFVVSPDGSDGSQHVVYLSPGRRPDHAAVGGEVLGLEIKSAREAALDAALATAGGTTAGGRIQAPMPGRVVRVLVAEGDAVDADDPLLIVEAMKMENEVRAPAAGVVRRVAVATGDTVEAGQLLCELDEPPTQPAT